MKKILALLIGGMMLLSAIPYGFAEETMSDKEYIESVLNLANNPDQEWTYNASADAFVLHFWVNWFQ